MTLIEHAKKELEREKLFGKKSPYNGMIGDAVLELIKVFSKQDHSGYSAEITIQLFEKLARFKTLSPITSDPKEWEKVDEKICGPNVWQNVRDSSYFSNDGGKTFYCIYDDEVKENVKN